jgi:TetR/AcrR family tetracycline transcriptional repressor
VAKRFDPEATEAELEAVRRAVNERFEREKARINKRLEKQLAQVNGGLNTRQEAIIAAALELLGNYGLSDLSLRDIAKKMDLRAPALYWYFKNKAELVDYMAEAILRKEFSDEKVREADEPWQHWLAAYMLKLRKAMLAFPDGGRVVAGAHLSPTKTLAQIFEDGQSSLLSSGLEEEHAFYTLMTAIQFTFGFVIEEQSGPKEDGIRPEFLEIMDTNYPNLAAVVRKFQSTPAARERAFIYGINLIIKGAERA